MKKIIRSPEIDFGLMDEQPDETIMTKPEPEWKIDADLPDALMAEALDLLAKGTRARKVAIHCGITIDKIKRL